MAIESGEQLLGTLTVGHHKNSFLGRMLNDCADVGRDVKRHIFPGEVPELCRVLLWAPYNVLLAVLSSTIVRQVRIVTLCSHL